MLQRRCSTVKRAGGERMEAGTLEGFVPGFSGKKWKNTIAQ
jgi:hypothetical protein